MSWPKEFTALKQVTSVSWKDGNGLKLVNPSKNSFDIFPLVLKEHLEQEKKYLV